MLLNKEQILQIEDLPFEDVEIPEWDGMVRVRTMTGMERDAFEESIVDFKNKDHKTNFQNLRAKLVAKTVIDENGNLLFMNEDVIKLGKKSAKALDRIFEVAQRLNGLGQKDIEELTKN